MLDIIETIEVALINILSLYIFISNAIYIIHSRRCQIHNWELGVPGALMGFLMMAFYSIHAFLPIEPAALNAVRRGITITTIAIFAGQTRVREKCLG